MGTIRRFWKRLTTFHVHVHSEGASDAQIILLHRIYRKVSAIMSAISDFAERVKAHDEQIDAAIEGIAADVVALNEKVAELQASVGTVTPEDQLLLDAIEARGAELAAKLKGLDDVTPPVAPVE